MAYAMVGTRLPCEEADDASTLEVIFFSCTFNLHTCVLVHPKNGLLSSSFSAGLDNSLRFFATGLGFSLFTIFIISSSLDSPEEISPGQITEAPVTCTLSNSRCKSSRCFGPRFRNLTWTHLIPLSGLLHHC
jgi:hypothetical protein